MLKQIMMALMGAAAIAGSLAGTAQAGTMSLTPQQEGEVDVGLGCLDGPTSCLSLDSIIASVISLEDSTSGTQSRLFVDYFGDGDKKAAYGNGSSKVRFQTKDAGTNSIGYWFRPSERQILTKGNGTPKTDQDGNIRFGTEEKGQLEVGTFQFNFAETLAELTIDFFDTESTDTTGVLAINGVDISSPDYIAKGPDSNVASQTFFDVNSITLKLGRDNPSGTGDGVNFRLAKSVAVPEPASLLGLAAIGAIAAGGALKKKQEA